MSDSVYVSVLIPAKNEASNLTPLLQEIRSALVGEDYEVIVVDDGSTDNTLAELRALKRGGFHQLRIISHARSLGQSTSIYHAATVARGHWLATLDGDGQNDPADIPGMLSLVRGSEGLAGGIKLVAGHRVNRRDTASKRWAFLRLPYFDHMHRYIPALIQRHKGRMIVHPVNHRHRVAGVSKYGNIDRALVGILDLMGVWWLIKRTKLDATPEELQ